MTETPRETSRWYHSIWFVVVMLFFVLGPLALPLLWQSPRFPRWAKWLLTIASLVSLIWITAKVIEIVRATLSQFQSLQ